MQKEIKYLRIKFFTLSASVSFAIIFIMLFILNLLMQLSTQKDIETASDMITQIAFANIPINDTEKISLKNAKRNADGNIPILRDPTTIESITLNGEVVCSDESELWYSAGGGIYFALTDSSGNVKYVHKEYKFNRGNTKITIDFLDNSNYFINGENINTDIAFFSKSGFYISSVWWTASSKGLNPENVTLELNSIEIQYRKNMSATSSSTTHPLQRNFTELFNTDIPQTLNNFSCFYVTSDNQGNIVEINKGNITESISENNIEDFIKHDKKSILLNDINYKHFSNNNYDYTIDVFVYSLQAEKNSNTLILVSILSGSVMFILVIILIYIVSGKAVKPISESMKKQKEFISNVSHELKTPITVISATTELMERKNGADKLTECIQAQAKKMGRLVNEMLTLTKLSEAQKSTSDFKQFDISECIKNSVLYFEGRAFEEEKEIKAEISENITFNGMPEKIDNLIGILLDNALKYSDEHAVIQISLTKEKDVIDIVCKNPCSNFNKNSISKLFERFYRADESHSGEKQGFGLGLPIAKEIVDLHKGNITITYNNKIVVFRVKFNIKK